MLESTANDESSNLGDAPRPRIESSLTVRAVRADDSRAQPEARPSGVMTLDPARAADEADTTEFLMEVGDSELEQASPTGRSVPPVRPSARPRSLPSSTPPARRATRSAYLPVPGAGVTDAESLHWMLADRALELRRAKVRIAELEAQVAFRDARIETLARQVSDLRARLEAAAEAVDAEADDAF
jgi:hypothetical protein